MPKEGSGSRLQLGEQGERLAEAFLVRRGAQVLERNWRARPTHHGVRGELDLIVQCEAVLVGVEVKTRRGTYYGHPFEAVDEIKLRRLHLLRLRLRLESSWSSCWSSLTPSSKSLRERGWRLLPLLLPDARGHLALAFAGVRDEYIRSPYAVGVWWLLSGASRSCSVSMAFQYFCVSSSGAPRSRTRPWLISASSSEDSRLSADVSSSVADSVPVICVASLSVSSCSSGILPRQRRSTKLGDVVMLSPKYACERE